jgi:hypothetical protein
MSVDFQRTTRRYIPEGSTIQVKEGLSCYLQDIFTREDSGGYQNEAKLIKQQCEVWCMKYIYSL